MNEKIVFMFELLSVGNLFIYANRKYTDKKNSPVINRKMGGKERGRGEREAITGNWKDENMASVIWCLLRFIKLCLSC